MNQSAFYTELSEGSGRGFLRTRVLKMGKHILIIVGGGEEHIGAVALGEPGSSLSDKNKVTATASVITRSGHKEDEIARKISISIASFLNQPVLVCCGIHYENITAAEIDRIETNIDSLISELKVKLAPKRI